MVSPRFAARLRVRAVDRAGRPVAGAGVELAHSVTYLASGIPILYHGPSGTAAHNLLAKHRAAVLIKTLDPGEIAQQLRES